MNKCNNCKKQKIFVAGPLFSPGDKFEQELIAATLEKNGYDTFLAQRDGFEFDVILSEIQQTGLSEEEAIQQVTELIFNFDVYQAYVCDGIVANINGAEPDAGTVSETALSFAMGKAVIDFKDDIRSFLTKITINPLLSQLSTVPIVTQLDELVPAVKKALKLTKNTHVPFKNLSIQLQTAIKNGKKSAIKYNKI